jgi:hypothetical protein
MMSNRTCWGILLVLAVTGCAAEDGGSNPGPDPDPDPDPQPDAGVAWPPECTGDTCGLPNTPDCCDDTLCVDFGDYGDVHCAAMTDEASQCESGCLVETNDGDSICAPEEWCGPGGITTEILCDVADACDWWENESTCMSYYEGCVDSLSASRQIDWINQVGYCLSMSTCGDFTNCMYYNVEQCW